ncbi:endonuclease/exonuclease/phosphatase family protein [Sphingomonas sp.]|uniref:endonuclease/exonuclease/phosphatase family protein n=1 Tax=Sphingomonas sp. TaxID=28214 RepID=UPI001EB0CCF0|nr:endonuclease/exonuclease/phosphatase family protein [Sphingomonas sp.]MBX3594964.1 endonuclease/exonuclease/phosphatase family protein [Sphingomonas sp.]
MIDRRSLLAVAGMAPLAACAPRPAAPRALLRLATFNIWHDAGDWAARLPLLVAALRAADADVIGLQEVLQDGRKRLPNQAETIAAALGGYRVTFMSTSPPDAANRYGNAVLTRLPVLSADTRKLAPLSDYRTAIRVRVARAGTPVDIVVTHLAWQPDAAAVRAQQVRDLLAWLPADGTPLVVMGDFNAPLADPGLAPLRQRGLVPAPLPPSVRTTLVEARGHAPRIIDHILADPGRFAIGPAHRIGDVPTDGEYPSDHFGVAAALRLS